MKGKIAAPIGALLLALALHAPAQVGACKANAAPQCRDSQVISASGNSINVWGNGALSGAFEEVIAGSPNTVSIVIQGCADGGTCTTLDTYTTVANSVRVPSIVAPYAYYNITATWSGGTGVSVTVNSRLTTAAIGSGGQPVTITADAGLDPSHGGTAICATGYACTSSYGTVLVTYGTTPTDADIFTVTWAGAKSSYAVVIPIQLLNSVVGCTVPDQTTPSTTSGLVYNASATCGVLGGQSGIVAYLVIPTV
jgi:hypothetical protein